MSDQSPFLEKLLKAYEESKMNNTSPTMPFGRFRGFALHDVPDSYLKWLVGNVELQEPLNTQIKEEVAKRGLNARRERNQGKRYIPHGERYPPSPHVEGLRETILAWYRKLSLRYHPDRGGSDREMMVLNEVKDSLEELLRNEGKW